MSMLSTNRGWWSPAPLVREAAETAAGGAERPSPPGTTLPFAALVVFVVISLLAPQTLVPALAPLRPALLTAVVAVGALVLDRLLHQRAIVTWSRELRLAACLAGWALVTLPFSYWPGGSVAFLFGTYAKTLVVFWLLGTVVDTRARLRHVVWALSLTAVPLAATAVRNFLTGAFVPEAVAVKRIVGYDAPLTENPNDLALMLNLILPLTIALLLSQRGRRARLLLTGVVLLNVVAVIVTFSRAGFLTLATTAVLYGRRLLTRSGRGWALAVGVLTLAALPLLPAGYGDRLGTITDIDSDPTGSAQARWADTVSAAAFVLTHPIVGAGIDMNVLALNEQRGPAWKAVHNVYLQLAVDLGLPGLILFLALLVGSIRGVASVRRTTAGDPGAQDLGHLAEGIRISLAAFAVAALFHPAAYTFYFYDIAGLGAALQAVNRNTECGRNASGS